MVKLKAQIIGQAKTRRIKSKDLRTLAKLNARIFGDSDISHILDIFKYSFKNRIGESSFILESIDGIVIGAIFTEKYKTFSAKKAAWIRSLFIDPKWQVGGLGKMLLKKAIDNLQAKNYSIFLSVDSENKKAQAIYLHAGFELEKLILKLDKKK